MSTTAEDIGAAVDVDRVERRLDDLWEIGTTSKGGVTRLAYSEEENEAFDYLLGELPDDYEVRTDSIGNVFATRSPDAEESIHVGSHLDSVFNGGRLDGTLGVVTALEALEAVRAVDAEPALPATLTVFRAEESSRFGQHTVGSRGALGTLTVEDFSATDQSGVPLWQAMQQVGFQPGNLSEPTIDTDRVAAFLEMHIEQGRVLEAAGDDVGVVTSIRAPVRYRVTVEGDYDHSGATPMGLRRDALVGAGEMVVAIEEVCEAAAEEGDLVGTVGDFDAVEGAINKVCGEASFPIDLRSNDAAHRDAVEESIVGRLDEIADRRGLTVDAELLSRTEPVRLDPAVIDDLIEAAEAVTPDHQRLPSGGGHDAMNFQLDGIPTGMVFVPSVDGISHNPKEETPREAIGAATETLARALLDYGR